MLTPEVLPVSGSPMQEPQTKARYANDIKAKQTTTNVPKYQKNEASVLYFYA
ncbi:MAG: hypothetical protein FWC26_06735 [Fibromonadales bacterium]|nr:hypothetical protein [Fibromonadales bacterium]